MAEVIENSGYRPTGQRQTLFITVLSGLLVGMAGWMLNLALQSWVIKPLFCQTTDSFAVCANGGTYAWVAAIVIVGIISLFIFIGAGVFRPLLIILASFIALWGVSAWLGPLEWWQGMLWHGGLVALAFGLFAWIARIDKFLISLILTIVVILLTRLLIVNV